MTADKKNLLCAVIAALLALSVFYFIYRYNYNTEEAKDVVTVGFVYDGDESTPYTANFIHAAKQLKAEYGKKVKIIERFNVPTEEAEETLKELAEKKCDIIFTNTYEYGETAKKVAESYPKIQFCAATCDNANEKPIIENYHTFMGEIYQGRYVSGLAAGAKLSEMIKDGTISSSQAIVGYVAAFPHAEVISGYTAFFLGVREQCPSAVMKVKYVNTWNSFALEEKAANDLINKGCVIISHHTNSIGTAVACEESDRELPAYHVGYNQDMSEIAPTTELISCRLDWAPYYKSAVEALLKGENIEKHLDANIHGNDASAGFDEGWVTMYDPNPAIASNNCKKIIDTAIAEISKHNAHIFKGDYKGTDPSDPSDTYDLNNEYFENKDSSAPSFHYVLDDIITIEE